MLFPQRWSRQFSRQLAMLLEEGVSLQEALKLVQIQQRGKSGPRILEQLRADLRGGAGFSHVLSAHPRQFKPHYLQTIKWAEASGSSENLALALRLLAGDTGIRPQRIAPMVDPVTGYATRR